MSLCLSKSSLGQGASVQPYGAWAFAEVSEWIIKYMQRFQVPDSRSRGSGLGASCAALAVPRGAFPGGPPPLRTAAQPDGVDNLTTLQ